MDTLITHYTADIIDRLRYLSTTSLDYLRSCDRLHSCIHLCLINFRVSLFDCEIKL